MISGAELSDAAEFINTITTSEFSSVFDALDGFVDEIRFQGFDPRAIVAALRNRENDAATLKKDICMMVALLCERGTKLSKIIGRSSPNGASKIRTLKEKYNLKDSARLPENITLARVAICLPQFTCSYMKICISPAVPWTSLDDEKHFYPKPMACSAFANLLDPKDTEMIHCHLYWAVKFNKLINPSSSKTTKEVGIECHKYAMIGANSTHISSDQKKKIREDLNLSPFSVKHYAGKYLLMIA